MSRVCLHLGFTSFADHSVGFVTSEAAVISKCRRFQGQEMQSSPEGLFSDSNNLGIVNLQSLNFSSNSYS